MLASCRRPRSHLPLIGDPNVTPNAELIGHANRAERLSKRRDPKLRLQHVEAAAQVNPAVLFFSFCNNLDRSADAVQGKIAVELISRLAALAGLRKLRNLLD